MRPFLMAFVLAFTLLAGCGSPALAPDEAAELVAAIAEVEGVEWLPATAVRQVAALLRGEAVEPVERTAENQVVSPLTGRPCAFVCKDGLTRAGVALVRLLRGRADG